MKAMLSRIANNLDYYGHPAGWVPSLGLETSIQLFDQEINADIPTLYLAYWIQNVVNKNQAAQNALQLAMAKLEQEANQSAQVYNAKSQLLPSLQTQAVQIADSTNRILLELQQKDQQLTQEAENNVALKHEQPFWKKALGVLGVAAKILPVFQPALGAIGTGLTVLSNIDTESPLQTAQGLVDVAGQLNSANIQQSKKQLDDQLAALVNKNGKPTADYIKSLLETGKKVGDAAAAVANATSTTQAPQNEVEAELKNLRQRDESFNKLVSEVTELNAQKTAFARSISLALDSMCSSTAQISSCLASMDAMGDQLNRSVASLDFGTLLYVKEMERRARDRLLRYQYYLARSYEYRLLQPYNGDYRLNTIFDQIRTLVSQGRNGAQRESV